MCPEHEMEKVNMYCEVCRRPVCHLCKLGGSHANHKVTSMSSAYKILKVQNRVLGLLTELAAIVSLSTVTNDKSECSTILSRDNKD